jgi:hypothetical protein
MLTLSCWWSWTTSIALGREVCARRRIASPLTRGYGACASVAISRGCDMPAKNKFLEAALGYAQRLGWPVFPLRPRAKEPLTAHGFKDAATDVEQISAWWEKLSRKVRFCAGWKRERSRKSKRRPTRPKCKEKERHTASPGSTPETRRKASYF